MSPIHYACNEGHLSTLKLLLANNADINIQNSLG
jgi:ankyrin repeat protein